MRVVAPLQVALEIELTAGPAAGQRRFRLTRSLGWPAVRLACDEPLPLEGKGSARVRFELPTGEPIEADARLVCDPEHPERGSEVELLGLTAGQLGLLEAYVESQMAYQGLPGLSLAIVHDQELVWSRGYGVLSTETGDSVTAASLFEAGSSTKAVTAIAVHQLIARGRIGLDDDVDARAKKATVREKTLAYLAYIERRRTGDMPVLIDEQAEIILNDFVPSYMKLRKKQAEAIAFPRNIVEHAFGSFIGGGIMGWIVIDIFAEAVIRNLTGMYVNFPGWWLGAAFEFGRPYVTAMHARLTSWERFERKRQELVERTKRHLELAWPDNALPHDR